jgi:hypothetical protein
MEWIAIITQIFEMCIVPLLGLLTIKIINWLANKNKAINEQIDNELVEKYTTMFFQTIQECVLATNQTYVQELKKQGKFDANAQKIAFEKTANAVLNILNEDAKACLTSIYGDLNAFLLIEIEAAVNRNK